MAPVTEPAQGYITLQPGQLDTLILSYFLSMSAESKGVLKCSRFRHFGGNLVNLKQQEAIRN